MTNRSEKSALRTSYKQARTAFATGDAEIRSQVDSKICEILLDSDVYKSASIIFVYVSIGDETDTICLIDRAFADGKTVCVPRTSGRGKNAHMDAVPLSRSDYLEMIESPGGAFGIPEPPADLPAIAPKEIDLIIVPSLAIDKRGIRLGYGGGYYDRYIEIIKETDAYIIAIQRSHFVVDTYLPYEEHDQTVDLILTEHGFISSFSI